MTSMRRELDRLRVMRALDAKVATTRQRLADERRNRRIWELTERETVAERRARLERDLVLFDLPQWEPQREMLRAGLAELPPPGSPDESLTWREFKARRATP